MKKIKHFLLTLAFLISFTSYSFSQEYEQKSLFLKVKEHISIELTKKNDKAWNLFLNKNGILNVSKAFRSVEMNQYYYIETKSNIDLAKLILEFKQFDFIEFAERVPIYNLFFTPNDPQYSNQWNLAKVQADQAWNINQGSTAIKIAVVDDGFLLNHEDLASQWHINTNEIPNNNIDDDNNGYIDDWRGWDAANNDNTPSAFNPTNSNFTHGTHVAGIVAGATNNSMGIASIGFNCKMIPVKIADDASSSLSGAYLGVEYAIMSGANIMNMSWGGSGYSATYQALFNLAKSKGMVCVAAAGNASTSMPMYPASYNNVISVASSTITDALSSFTNYGATIDVTAPGSNILSSLAGSTSSYGNFDGTSMASPLVAGICGLMMSNNLGMHPDSVEACLKRSCDNIDSQNPNFMGQFGAGRVNAFKALQCTQKAPLADFEILDTFQCVNTIVRYKSNSSGIQPLTYSWSFPGGTPSTSTLANPQVTYSSPGLYSATLTVTNNFGTHFKTKTNTVRIGTPTAKLSGRKYTTYGTNSAILAINFIGTPPYNITLTDGSNVWTQNNITSNPYFYSNTPIKDTSIIQIQSFTDKNCVGIGSVVDTIVKLNASTKTMCRDSIEVTSAQNGWQALQPNNTWGSLSPCSFSSGVFNANSSNISGITYNDCLWGPSNTSRIRQIYTNWGQTNTSTGSLDIVKLRKDVSIPLNAFIDSIRIWSLVDDVSDSIFFNNKLVHTTNIPVYYGQRVYSSVALNIGNVSTQNFFYLNEGDFGGSYGSFFKAKIYYSIPCEANSNDNSFCENSFNFDGSSNNVVKIDPQNGAAWKDLYSVNGFTWECWFNLGNRNSNSFSNTESLISATDANYCEDMGLHFNWPGWPGVGKLNWVASGQTGCSAPTGVASTNMTFNANTWYHAAGVMNYSTNTMQLYVNGNLVGSKSLTIPLNLRMQNNVAVTIGNQDINYNPYSGSFSPFKGKIDEIRFWNIPRTASDIQASYKNCLPASTPNLVAYFKGDEGNGTKTASLINNNFIGTLQNGATWSTQVDSVKNCTLCNNNNNQTCDTTGLILCMAMDGNANDSTKYNNHGIIRGATPTIGRDGKTNSAYYFNGTTNHINLGVKNILKPSAASISVWVKPQTFNSYIGTNSNTIIITKNPNNPSSFMEGYSLSLTNRTGPTKYMAINTHQPTNNEKWFMSNQNTNINQWTHLVFTFDFDSIKLYVNGQLDKKIYKGFNNVYDAFDSVVIGYSANIMNKNYFKGDIDELKMYNRVLSSSEILNLYSKPFTCSCVSSSSSNQTDCDTTNLNVGKVLHLDFNGNTQDKSGNNNHATNFGATLVAGKDGLANTAYRLNGLSNYLEVLNSSSINNISNAVTIAMNVKINGFNPMLGWNASSLLHKGVDNNQGNFALVMSNGIFNSADTNNSFINFNFFNNGYTNMSNSALKNPSNIISKNKWYCIVAVFDGDSISTYYDGVLKHKFKSLSNFIPYNSSNLRIGRSFNGSPDFYYLNADIDDIQIYNRALSASEVKGYCGTCNISPPISVKCDTGKKYVYTKCFNDTIQLNVGKGKNHQWSPTTDLSNGTIQNPKCFAKSSIQYFVLYNDTHNCQIIDTFQINVFPSNHIPLFDSTVCIGDSIFYSLDNNGSNYNWNPNQYLSSNNQSSVWIKPLTNTSYNISYKDLNGCKILDTFDLKTKVCCDLKAQFEISDSIICKSGLVSIFNKSKNITNGNYSWEFKNLTPSQFIGYSPASISLNSPGTYNIKLKTSNGICEDSMIRNIYVIDIKANAGKDSTFCTGRISNFKIGNTNTISDYKYSWNPTLGLNNADISSPTVNISQNQQYELSVYDPFTGCIALDTIILTINSNLDTFNYVDTLCDGDTKVFFGQNIMIDGTYQHYVKDNQNCDKEVHILKVFFRKISYTNSIQKACNFYIDKMGIKHTDSFEYNDTTYTKGCITNIHTTKIKILKTRYEETDMTACYKINWKGNTYFDTIKKIDSFVFKDNGCDTLVKYVNLNIVKKAEIKIISTHANPLNYGEEIILQAFGSNNYKWNTGERGFQISHKAKENNVFYVIGYNNILCPDTAYYNIYIDNNSVIELPDIFSPNEDGKNDIFRPNYKGNVQILDLIIFNRWGEKIYEGHGNETFWDGKFKGEYQSSGVYIYLFKYIFNGKEVSKKGSFVLVR